MKVYIYGADFETDNDGESAWIVQWAISDGDSEVHGSTLDGYIDAIYNLLDKHKRTIVYFHNFAYDMRFQTWLFQDLTNNGYVPKYLLRNGRPIQISFEGSESKLTFRDSMAKMPGSLKNLAKSIGLVKLESPRDGFGRGWSQDLTDADWEYVDNDARIVARAMSLLHAEGRSSATASSDAWNFAKKMLGPMTWRNYFPRLSPKLDGELRHAYMGGLNVSQNRGYYHGQITHEDVHSMYPTVMTYDMLPIGQPIISTAPKLDLYVKKCCIKLKLKEGLFPWFQFKDAINAQMEDVKTTTPIVETREYHVLWLTNVDLDTLSKWYDITEHPTFVPKYYCFKGKVGIFEKYIQHWYKEKESQPKGSLLYNSAKRMMNALYGRFALNPEVEENMLVFNPVIETFDFQKRFVTNEDNDAYVPFALFVTAHARRRLLENAFAVGPENVIHCDTDSVIHKGLICPGIPHGSELGTWGVESEPWAIWEAGYKRYVEQLRPVVTSHHDLVMACAGVPQNVNNHDVPIGMWVELLDNPAIILEDGYTLGRADYCIQSKWLRDLYIKNNMNPDKVNTYKLIPVKCKGGVILEERQHKINDNMVMRLRRG